MLKSMRPITALLLLALMSSLCVLSCKDDEPINNNIITKDYYFQAVLDGDTVTYQEGVDEYTNIIGDFYGAPAANGRFYCPFTCIAANEAATNPIPSLLAKSGAVGIIASSPSAANTLATYAALIGTGTYGVGRLPRDSSQTGIAGFYISVFDKDGVEWNTNNGPVGTGTLNVSEYNTYVDNSRIPATQKIITAAFNCTVYNATGQSKTLTGGKVRGRIILWQ
jgi:hypothetical protein